MTRFWLMIGALSALACGGGAGTGGTYCVIVDASTHDFLCETGTLAVSVSNTCEQELTLTEPIIDPECSDLLTISNTDGVMTLAPGEAANFEVQYLQGQTELWDCRITFPHDLAGEASPELPVAGGGDSC